MWCTQSYTALKWCHPSYISAVPVVFALHLLGSPYTHRHVNRNILQVYSQCNRVHSKIAPSCEFNEPWETDVFMVYFTSISLGFIHVLLHNGFEISGRGEQLWGQKCSQVLANKRIIDCKAQNFKKCFCTCGKRRQMREFADSVRTCTIFWNDRIWKCGWHNKNKGTEIHW